MFKNPGFALKIVALGLALVGLIVILGIPSQPVEPTAPVLPTHIIAPTETQSPQVGSTPTIAVQPSALPPTALPSEIAIVALQPTNTLPTTTIQPSPLPAIQPIALPLPEQSVPNQVTIQFAPDTSLAQQQAYIQSLGGQLEKSIAPLNTVVVTLPDTAQALLAQSPIVIQTEPDYYVRAQQSTPNDPLYSQQWALPVMKAADAWPLLPANTPVITVAVIDSGICATHPDLAGRILPGYDFVQNDSTPQDEYGHGCEVTGVIAANMNNGMGIAGVAPNTQVMPLRVLDAAGNGFTSNVAAAITYATDNGAQIINLSLGGSNPSIVMEEAVNYAVARGVLVIAAAGNTGGSAQPGVIYPAAYPNVVAVASIDQNLQISSFSSFGPEVDLLAPGRNIITTKMNGSYGNASGTSFAAPQVTGIAALEMAQGRILTQGGGIAQVYVPVPEPTVVPTITPVVDKHGNIIIYEPPPTLTDTWAVNLIPGSDANSIASQLGYENLGQIGTLPNTYLFRVPNSGSSLQVAQDTSSLLQTVPDVLWSEQQTIVEQFPRIITDPQFPDQWHLEAGNGTIQGANVKNAWADGYDGTGSVIAIVDDGLQWTTYNPGYQPLLPNPDIFPNYVPSASHNYNGGNYGDNDPGPILGSCTPTSTNGNCHGTAVGGIAAAADDGTSCGVGVAYNAGISGIRLIAQDHSTDDEADALTFQNQTNDIYNSSWGPKDYIPNPSNPALRIIGPLAPLSETVRFALQTGVTSGRGGLGSIYVWAAGNGLQYADNINADGYASSRYVIAVGAVDQRGDQAFYSEPGAAMFVTAPGGGTLGLGITTSDLISDVIGAGYSENGDCTGSFIGTSASAPIVSGVIALMLQANPNLGWRDVKYILAETAGNKNQLEPGNDKDDPDWTTNAAGYHINHKYGFGRVNAASAVQLAESWINVGLELSAPHPDPDPLTVEIEPITVNQPIPSAVEGGGVSSTTVITQNLNVETVEVTFRAIHSFRGDVEVILTSPSGTKSRMMWRPNDNRPNFVNWKMTTVRNWGEQAAGTWTLTLVDRFPDSNNGTFDNWQLVVYGTAAPPKQPTPLAPANDPGGLNPIITALPWSNVTLSWDMTDVYAEQIQLQLDTVNPPVTTYNDLVATASSYSSNLALGTYYWRVRAVDDDPNTLEPDWASITPQTFTVATSQTVAPERNYFLTPSPILTWKDISWATGYQVEISTSSTFAVGSTVYITPENSPIAASETSFVVVNPATLPDGLPEGTYYWRVRARKADGTWSTTWSITDSFIVDLPP